MPTKVERTCERCSKTFMAEAWRVKRGGSRFCSKPCANGTRKEAQCTCRSCGKEFWVATWQVTSGRGGQFCSRACQAKGFKHTRGGLHGSSLKRPLITRERANHDRKT